MANKFHAANLEGKQPQGRPFEIITDIGSGINYRKKGLQDLIRKIESNQAEKVVILYKDRLLRFGFDLIETIATIHNCKIEIVDTTQKSEEDDSRVSGRKDDDKVTQDKASTQ